MAIRKIFVSTDNYDHSIEMGLHPKGQLVSVVVCNNGGKKPSHLVINLHPDDALALCKDIKESVGLLKKGGSNGTR